MEHIEPFLWYSFAILGFFVLLLLKRAHRKLNACATWVSRRLQHRVFLYRNSWSPLTISVVDAMAIFAFAGVNALLAFTSRKEDLPKLAIVNMVPLFLGGRTNTQVDFLRVSLATYQLTHHWLGRIVVFQSILHCAFSFQSSLFGPSKIAGAIAGVLLILNLLLSLLPVRRWIGAAAFGLTHLVLSLAILAATGIHTALLTSSLWTFSSILCMVAGCLFTISSFLRFARKIYQGKPDIFKHKMVGDTATIWLRLDHSIQARPGTYFYLRFPSLPLRFRFQSILLPVAFWQAEMRGSSKEISFIVPHPMSQAITNARANVSIDGPYGGGLRPGMYELVILLAEGLGIAGVLPLALSILSRRSQDESDKASQNALPKLYCDKTRKLDLVWVLQDNSQVHQALEFLESLKNMAVSKMLMVWILYPEPGFLPQFTNPKPKKTQESEEKVENTFSGHHMTPDESQKLSKELVGKEAEKSRLEEERNWFEHYVTPDDYPNLLKALISKESKRTPGKGIVYACGSGPFCHGARTAVRSIHSSTTFTEVDYQPSGPCSGLRSNMDTTSLSGGSEKVIDQGRTHEAIQALSQHVIRGRQGQRTNSHRARHRPRGVVLDKDRVTGHIRNPRPTQARVKNGRARVAGSGKGLSATLND